MKHLRHIISLVLCLGTLATVKNAGAQDSEAQLRYELGSELYQQQRYPEALEHFLASFRLTPTANMAFNIAQVYGLLDRHVEAYNWFETYLSQFELDEAGRERGIGAREALLEHVAVVEARTSPEGAELFVDRPELGTVGRSPRHVAMTPGTHHLIARFDGYREANSEVEARQGDVTVVELELTAIVGQLRVGTRPAGAEVSIEGTNELLGTTPLDIELPIGDHLLTVTHAGHTQATRRVSVTEDRATILDVDLERLPETMALLSVISDPAGATVLLDGNEVGQTPLSLASLEPGPRRLEVNADDHSPWIADILLEPGSATRAEAALEVARRRLWPGWRWFGYAGGGVVLVAGAALGGVALAGRNAFFESENPTREMLDRVRAESIAADALIVTGALIVGVTLILDLVMRRVPTSTGSVSIDR